MVSESVKNKFPLLSPFLDERTRRLWSAAEALSLGYGGVSAVSRATGVSRRAITEGCKELKEIGPQNKTLSSTPSVYMKLPFSRSHVCEKNKFISDGLVKTLNLHHTVIPAQAGIH